MKRLFSRKLILALLILGALAAFSPTEARAGWPKLGRNDDCGTGLTFRQARAESACELARAQQMSDLSCCQLRGYAEAERYAANQRALASYNRVGVPLHTHRTR